MVIQQCMTHVMSQLCIASYMLEVQCLKVFWWCDLWFDMCIARVSLSCVRGITPYILLNPRLARETTVKFDAEVLIKPF